MAKSIMIQGTASSAGKSFITAGLLRVFSRDGYRAAPFKSQNMALNSYVTADGLEMGRAQVMQARACGIEPDARMNPVLLKPADDRRSQVIVGGKARGDMDAKAYFAYKNGLVPDIMRAYHSLAAEYGVIVIEGAGSPAEINLREDDIVNMGMARMAKAPVLLVGDIDRGGVFAAVFGTLALLGPGERAMVKGVIINKFRGDPDILKPGLDTLEELTGTPVLGVLPYLDIAPDDEDSLTERFGARGGGLIDIAVVRLPRISNFTDFNAFDYIDGVSLRYIKRARDFGSPDLVILPGTKNTMADLGWLRETGLSGLIARHAKSNKPVFGICGGMQMLGADIRDPLGAEGGGGARGLGLLPVETEFAREKTLARISGRLDAVTGVFEGLSNLPFDGYEIHMGVSDTAGRNIINRGNVYGTYIHGVFDAPGVSGAVAEALYAMKGAGLPDDAAGLNAADLKAIDLRAINEKQFDILEESVRRHLDMRKIYEILERGL